MVNRRKFAAINRYQIEVMMPVFAAFFLSLGILIGSLSYIGYVASHLAVFCSMETTGLQKAVPWFMTVERFNMILPLLIFFMITFLSLVVCWAYRQSSRFVGGYSRLVAELDRTLEEKQDTSIKLRRHDHLLQELLKRINILIEKSRR